MIATECPRCEAQYLRLAPGANCPACELRGQYVALAKAPPPPEEPPLLGDLTTVADLDPEESGPRLHAAGFTTLMGALGGLCRGSTYLCSGDPGVGKSTLATQLALGLLESGAAARVLYVAGEEPGEAVSERVRRLEPRGAGDAWGRFCIFNTTDAQHLRAMLDHYAAEHGGFDFLVADSVQVLYDSNLPQAPGSIAQVLAVTNALKLLARAFELPAWLLAHVTKDGQVAGPRSLEHLVDVVAQLEVDDDDDDDEHRRRLVVTKNRRARLAGPVRFRELDTGAWRER